jgi:hypothetical protein
MPVDEGPENRERLATQGADAVTYGELNFALTAPHPLYI